MSFYDRLAERAHQVVAQEQETSYFSTPETELDPRLFDGQHLKESIRGGILAIVYGFWGRRYAHPYAWSRVYLAGSGVSYQWSAAREPGDLDCLVGVDFVGFRRSNPDFAQLSDQEIADHLNREFHERLWPKTAHWNGFELTFFVNHDAYDIRRIHPYAAYDLTSDNWAVDPDPNAHPLVMPEWVHAVNNDKAQSALIIRRYNKALEEVDGSLNPGGRLNASITLRAAAREGAALYDSIHEGRKKAFSSTGQGYNSLPEYRYKSAKATGILAALRELKDELRDAGVADEEETYGSAFPGARELLVSAAVSRRYRG